MITLMSVNVLKGNIGISLTGNAMKILPKALIITLKAVRIINYIEELLAA